MIKTIVHTSALIFSPYFYPSHSLTPRFEPRDDFVSSHPILHKLKQLLIVSIVRVGIRPADVNDRDIIVDLHEYGVRDGTVSGRTPYYHASVKYFSESPTIVKVSGQGASYYAQMTMKCLAVEIT